jgi:hypothetical protein
VNKRLARERVQMYSTEAELLVLLSRLNMETTGSGGEGESSERADRVARRRERAERIVKWALEVEDVGVEESNILVPEKEDVEMQDQNKDGESKAAAAEEVNAETYSNQIEPQPQSHE